MPRKTTPKEADNVTDITAKKKENMILALQKTLGVVSPACKKARISRETHYRWYDQDSVYRAKVDETKEVALDFVESKLYKRISENSDSMIMYYLNNRGGARGYGNKLVDPNSESELVVRIIREEKKKDE